MKLDVTIELWKRRNYFVAKCLDLDFVSQGRTPEEAKNNLIEVIQIQFEEMSEMGNLDEYMAECGYKKTNGDFITQSEIISFEKHSPNADKPQPNRVYQVSSKCVLFVFI